MSANKLSVVVVLAIGFLLSAGGLALTSTTVFADSSSSAPSSAATTVPSSEKKLRIAMLAAEAHFDSNTMTLTPEGYQALQRLLEQLDAFHEVLSIRIVGHTDNIGSVEFNQSLSLQRANTIREQFANKYANSHLLSIGMGESQPVAKNDTQEGRERNRRVEIQVIARGYMPVTNGAAATNN